MVGNPLLSGLIVVTLLGLSCVQAKDQSCDRFQFRCASGSCVKRESLCDGRFDCGSDDVSDESNCGESTCSHSAEISRCQSTFMSQSSFGVSAWVSLNFSGAFHLASWKQLGDSCPAYKTYSSCVQPYSKDEKCAKQLAINNMLKSIFNHFCENFMSLQAMAAVGCVETLDNTSEVGQCAAQSQLIPPSSHEETDLTPSGKICTAAMTFERFLACLAPFVHQSCGASAELFLRRFAERLENDTAVDCASLKLLQSSQKKCGEVEKRRYGECLTTLDQLSGQLDTFHFSNPLALASDPHNLSVTCGHYNNYHDCMESVKFCFERDSTLLFMKASVGLMCNPETTKSVSKFQANSTCGARVGDNVPLQVCLTNFSEVFDAAVNDITVNLDGSWGSFCQAVASLINFASCAEPHLMAECANDTAHLAESILDYAAKIGMEDGCMAENEPADLRLPDWIPHTRTAPNCTALETNLLFSCFAPFSGLLHNSTSFNWSSFGQVERIALLSQACSAYVLYESCRKAVMGDSQCQLTQDEFRSPGGAKVFSHNFIRKTFGDECQQRLLPTTDQLCLDALPKVADADVCVSEAAEFFSQFAQRAPEFVFGDPETCYTSLGLIRLSGCLGRIANETCRSPLVPQILFAHENIYREASKHCKPLSRMKELITAASLSSGNSLAAAVCAPPMVHRCSSDLSRIAAKIINDSGPPLSLPLGLSGHVQTCAAFRLYQNCTAAGIQEGNCRIVWPLHSFLLAMQKFLCESGLPRLEGSAKRCLTDLVNDVNFRPCAVGLWNLLAKRFDPLLTTDSFALFCDLLQTLSDFLQCSRKPTLEACGHQLDPLRKNFSEIVKSGETNGGCSLSNSTVRIGASIPIVTVEASPGDPNISTSIKSFGVPMVHVEPISHHKPATSSPNLTISTTEIIGTPAAFHLELKPPDIFGLEDPSSTTVSPLVYDLVVTAKMFESAHSSTVQVDSTTKEDSVEPETTTITTTTATKTTKRRRTTTITSTTTSESADVTTDVIESLLNNEETTSDVSTTRHKFFVQIESQISTTLAASEFVETESTQLTTELFTDEQSETTLKPVTYAHRYLTKNPETLVIRFGEQTKVKLDTTVHRYLIEMHLPMVIWDESMGDPNTDKRKDLTQKIATNLRNALSRKLPGMKHLRVITITEGVTVTLEADAVRHNSTAILQAIRDQLVLQSGKIGDVTVDGVTVAELVEEIQTFSTECGDAQKERISACMQPLSSFPLELKSSFEGVWGQEEKQNVAKVVNRTCAAYESALMCAKPYLKSPCTSGNCYIRAVGALCTDKRKIYSNLDCFGRVLNSLNVTSCLDPQATGSHLMEFLSDPSKMRQSAGRFTFCLIEPLAENCGQLGANLINKLLLLAQRFPNDTECQVVPAAEQHETPPHRSRPAKPQQQIVLSAKPVVEPQQIPLLETPHAEPAKVHNATVVATTVATTNTTAKSSSTVVAPQSTLTPLLAFLVLFALFRH